MDTPRPMTTVWLFNFDAESELESPDTFRWGAHPQSTRFGAFATHLSGLHQVGDLVRTPLESQVRPLLPNCVGRAWMMTPRARDLLSQWGIAPVPAPSLDVLQEANGRAFCHSLGGTLPESTFVRSVSEFLDATNRPCAGGTWLAKRALACAGRGSRKINAQKVTEADVAWAAASLPRGMEISPWVLRTLDASLHGFVFRAGTFVLGQATGQECDAGGQWIRSTPQPMLRDAERQALVRAGEETAAALAKIGYFGPFGIDAFRYLDANDVEQFLPRCEINARYGMGWHIGMGDKRPDLLSDN